MWNYIQVELELHELEFFEWNSSSRIFFFTKFNFAITRLFKNRVLHLKIDFLKIEFQNRDISLNNFRHAALCWKVCKKWVKSHFGLTSTHVNLSCMAWDCPSNNRTYQYSNLRTYNSKLTSMISHKVVSTTNLFDKRFLVTLFKYYGNTCGLKSIVKIL